MDHRSPRSVAACRSVTVMRRSSGQADPLDMTSAFLVATTVVDARFHPACSPPTAPGESAASRARPANASGSQLLTVTFSGHGAAGSSRHPVEHLADEVHGGVRMQEREPGDCLALPYRRRSERHLVAEQLVGPAGGPFRGPPPAAE